MRHIPPQEFEHPSVAQRMAAEIRVHGDSFAALFGAGFSGAEISQHYDEARDLAQPQPLFSDKPHDRANLLAAVGRVSALAMMGTLLGSANYPGKR